MITSFKNTVIVSTVVHCFVFFSVFGLSDSTFKKPKKVEIYNVKLVEMPRVEKAKAAAPKVSKAALQKKENVIKKTDITQKKKPAIKPEPESKPKEKPTMAVLKPKTETTKKDTLNSAPETPPKNEAAKKENESIAIKENAAIGDIDINENNSGELPSWYAELIREKIYRLWQCPPGAEVKEAVIRFEIERDGTVLNAVLEKGSGILTFDESALITIARVGKLNPLPEDFKGERLTVHFTFKREG